MEMLDPVDRSELQRRVSLARAYLAAQRDDDLAWSVVPDLVTAAKAVPAPRRAGHRAALAMGTDLGRALSTTRGPALFRSGHVYFASTSTQQLRVLAPVMASMGGAVRVSWPRLRGTAFLAARRKATACHDRLTAWFGDHGVFTDPVLVDLLTRSALMAEKMRVLAAGRDVRMVAVGSQHNAAARSVLVGARDLGVTTAYIPHAPVARNANYEDLPTDVALLRGDAEEEHYTALGADGRIDVVGDPSLGPLPSDPVPWAGAAVAALPPTDSLKFSSYLAFLRAADLRDLQVAPHPRTDEQVLRAAMDPSWVTLSGASTFAALNERGASAVVQYGSGVGLEALLLGLPVIDICPQGSAPDYPYLDDPLVCSVSTTEQLAECLFNRQKSSAGLRSARTVYARRWVGTSGRQSARLAAGALDRALELGRSGALLLDGWRPAAP